MAFAQPNQTKKGSWVEEKILGSGGFGQVVLWKNEVKLISSAHRFQVF